MVLWIAVLMSSCEKITNVRLVNGASTGKLSYKLIDDFGNGLAGVRVSLYNPENILNNNSPLLTTFTDQDGIAYFSDLFPKDYFVKSGPATVNKIKYSLAEYAQVVAGQDKNKVVKVTSLSGSLDVKLISSQDYTTPIKDVVVVAFPSDVSVDLSNVASIIKESTLKGVSDANGFVSIKVPSDEHFNLIFYNPVNGNLDYSYGNLSVAKDMRDTFTFYLSRFSS